MSSKKFCDMFFWKRVTGTILGVLLGIGLLCCSKFVCTDLHPTAIELCTVFFGILTVSITLLVWNNIEGTRSLAKETAEKVAKEMTDKMMSDAIHNNNSISELLQKKEVSKLIKGDLQKYMNDKIEKTSDKTFNQIKNNVEKSKLEKGDKDLIIGYLYSIKIQKGMYSIFDD